MTVKPQRLIESEAPPKTQYTNMFDYDGSGNLIYQGWAQSLGAPLVTGAVWAIKKFTYSTVAGNSVVTLVQWATGGETNIWNNRASTVSYQ